MKETLTILQWVQRSAEEGDLACVVESPHANVVTAKCPHIVAGHENAADCPAVSLPEAQEAEAAVEG